MARRYRKPDRSFRVPHTPCVTDHHNGETDEDYYEISSSVKTPQESYPFRFNELSWNYPETQILGNVTTC